ncbi:hypothetical protein SeMB42_g07005 [Synchytrium endobioticum]|nr:hypothetical protein SeMB42_g07005 [Synchytrium endobioticum]
MSPFFATTGQNASLGSLLSEPISPSNVPEANRVREHFANVQRQLQGHLETARDRYKQMADNSRREEVELHVGDEVLVSTKNVRTDRPTKKLDYKWMGPFFVKRKINRVAYEVELPSSIRIHPVFHISLLKRYKRPSDPSKQLPKPPPMQVTSDDGWVIKDIIEVRRRGRGFEYLIDWEGFGPEDRTWEPRWHLNDDRLLQQWHQKHPEKISPFGKLRGVVRHGEGGNVTNVTVVSSHDDTAKPSIGQDLVQKGLGGDSSTPPKPSDAFDRLCGI